MPEPVTLTELKEFARVDTGDQDTLIENLGIAAREYVETATGRDYSSAEAVVPEKAKVAILGLAAHWYEQREAVVLAQGTVVPMHVRAIINQLKDWQDPETVEEEAEA